MTSNTHLNERVRIYDRFRWLLCGGPGLSERCKELMTAWSGFEQKSLWIDGRTDGWMDERMDGWMDEWMDERMMG